MGDVSKRREALRELVRRSVHRGTVTLASGAVSDFYIDGRLVTLTPEGSFLSANVMAEMAAGTEFVAVGGPTMGADPIIGALCYHFWAKERRSLTGFIIRKEAKGHGLQKLVEGPALAPGSAVVIVEDVVTSGGSILKAVRAVEDLGCQVVKILALVDREQGAVETLSGYDFQAVFSRSELE